MPPKTSMPKLKIIVAVDTEGGFGKDGKIPWFFPEDLKHFQKITKDSICIMGRKTYEDMAEMILSKRKDEDKDKPILKDRESIVISSKDDYDPVGAKAAKGIRIAIHSLDESDHREVFVIGGEKMFIEALPFTDTIYMTIVKGEAYDCDRFFPLEYLNKNFVIKEGEETDDLYYVTYVRK